MASIIERLLMSYIGRIPLNKLKWYVDNNKSVVDEFYPFVKEKYSHYLILLKPEDINVDSLAFLAKKERPDIFRVVTKSWLIYEVGKVKRILSR